MGGMVMIPESTAADVRVDVVLVMVRLDGVFGPAIERRS